MNLTALALMNPTFQKRLVKDYLHQRYPAFAKATSASRLFRSRGKDERFIYLYDGTINNGKYVGRCLPKTMELFVEAGLWEAASPRFPDYQPDTAYGHWYPCGE